MKLIIDIPEIFYQNEKENKGYVSDLKRNIVWDAMIKGTPLVEQEPILDKIVAEVKKASVEKPYDGQAFGGEQMVRTQDVLDIIYKHMEGEES